MVKQNRASVFTPALTAPFSKAASWPRRVHIGWKPSLLSQTIHRNQTRKKSLSSVVEPYNIDNTGQRMLAEERVLDTQTQGVKAYQPAL